MAGSIDAASTQKKEVALLLREKVTSFVDQKALTSASSGRDYCVAQGEEEDDADADEEVLGVESSFVQSGMPTSSSSCALSPQSLASTFESSSSSSTSSSSSSSSSSPSTFAFSAAFGASAGAASASSASSSSSGAVGAEMEVTDASGRPVPPSPSPPPSSVKREHAYVIPNQSSLDAGAHFASTAAIVQKRPLIFAGPLARRNWASVEPPVHASQSIESASHVLFNVFRRYPRHAWVFIAGDQATLAYTQGALEKYPALRVRFLVYFLFYSLVSSTCPCLLSHYSVRDFLTPL
jgi:hypothetical protein